MPKRKHDILDRFKIAVNVKTDMEAAKILNLKPTALTMHRKRKTIPYEQLLKACMENNINIRWVMTGEGDQYEIIQAHPGAKGRAISRLFRLLGYLSPENIDKVIRYVEIAYERKKLEEQSMEMDLENEIKRTGTRG